MECKEICSLFMVCVIFLILSYYAVYNIVERLCGKVNRASSRRNLVLDDSNPDDPSLRLQKHGLEFSLVKSLPIYQFKKNEGEEQKPINRDCAICLGEFEDGEWLKHLPSCTHGFHVSSIGTWFQTHSNCPLCRSNVHYDLAANLECSVSTYTLLETLRREDFFQESAAHSGSIHFENLEQLSRPG